MPREALPERAENLVGRGYFPLLLPMAAVFWTPGLGRVDQGHLSHFFSLFTQEKVEIRTPCACPRQAGVLGTWEWSPWGYPFSLYCSL